MAALERIILTTGGTGGHVFPALAVAEELRARRPDAAILFVGGAYGPEGDMAARAGLPFAALPVRGVFGRGLGALTAAWSLGWGLGQAVRLVREFRPQAVVGFGGYAGFCALGAAVLLRLPTAIHEQNAVPGMANRLLGRLADRVFLSFPDETSAFPARKRLLTGNPVRAAIRSLRGASAPRTDADRHLLVIGGSQGARAVNEAVLGAAPRLLAGGVRLRLMTGPRHLEAVRERGRALGLPLDAPTCQVTAFIEDMAEAYGWADLVLCRAGATTAAELTAAGKPALFIPFPHATHGHQLANALALRQAGAALVVEEKDLPATDLASTILGLLADPARLAAMAEASAAQGRPGAAAALADELERLI